MQVARIRVALVIAGAALISGILGCGRNGGPEIVPVAGKVAFEGREQPAVCRLTFVPAADSSGAIRPSGAELGADGNYELTPFRGVRGLYPGTYSVRVSYYDLKPGGDANVEADWIAHEHESPEPLIVESGVRRVAHDITVPAK